MDSKTAPSPNRANLSFTAVICPQSPAAASPQKNLTGLPRIVKDSVADVYNSIQRWNDCYITGSRIVKKVTDLKSDLPNQYCKEVDTLLAELYNVVQNMKTNVDSLNLSHKQLEAVLKLKRESTPLFRSMTIEKLHSTVGDIANAYKSELGVKEYILGNIGYSEDKNQSMFYAACWVHQRFITDAVNAKLEAILIETGHRQYT